MNVNVTGPAFWGLINPEWSLCNKGRRQSPVNLEPSRLLFDPNLQPLHLDKHRVKGILTNTGHSVVFTVDNETRHPVNISGGSLSYRYQFHEIHLHYGLYDESGSEHTVDGYAFPAEVSQYFFIIYFIQAILCTVNNLLNLIDSKLYFTLSI